MRPSSLGPLFQASAHESSADRPARRFILGGPFGAEPAEVSFERLNHFADLGGLVVETSRSYARGSAEQVVGQWMRKNPRLLGVVTKVGHSPTGENIPLDRRTVQSEVRTSLETLGVEAVDVLLLHCDDPTRYVAELADTLVELVDSGHAHRVGVSNWTAPRLAELARELAARNHRAVASYQFSLAEPDPARLGGSLHADDATLGVIRDYQLPLLSWSAQARGFFARTEDAAADGRADPYDTEPNRARRERCADLAARLGTRPETVALAWTLHHPNVWPSIGPKTTEQIDRSLDAASISLTPEQLGRLRSEG